MFETLLNGAFTPEIGLPWRSVLVAMLTSFVLCQLIASVYTWTYRGLSYSRSFVVSLALAGLVATILMLAIGNNIARGLGLLGTLAIVRFRTNMRDTRDMIFIFAVLSVGIAAGVQAVQIALIGAAVFCLFAVHLAFSPFGRTRQFDGLLRLNTPTDEVIDTRLKHVLRQHCSHFVLVNLREVAQGGRLDQSYQVKLREPSYQHHLVTALGHVGEVQDVALLLQDDKVEV